MFADKKLQSNSFSTEKSSHFFKPRFKPGAKKFFAAAGKSDVTSTNRRSLNITDHENA